MMWQLLKVGNFYISINTLSWLKLTSILLHRMICIPVCGCCTVRLWIIRTNLYGIAYWLRGLLFFCINFLGSGIARIILFLMGIVRFSLVEVTIVVRVRHESVGLIRIRIRVGRHSYHRHVLVGVSLEIHGIRIISCDEIWGKLGWWETEHFLELVRGQHGLGAVREVGVAVHGSTGLEISGIHDVIV